MPRKLCPEIRSKGDPRKLTLEARERLTNALASRFVNRSDGNYDKFVVTEFVLELLELPEEYVRSWYEKPSSAPDPEEKGPKPRRNLSTEESRKFWADAKKTAADVRSWPDSKRAGINVEPPEVIAADLRQRANEITAFTNIMERYSSAILESNIANGRAQAREANELADLLEGSALPRPNLPPENNT
jgi:hypothetical protein